jgi:hypothetical protein
MDQLIVFSVFLGFAIVLIVQYLVAKTFQEIATMKGYSSTKYFWFCFFLGIAGYLMVVALPANADAPAVAPKPAESSDVDELPEI